MEHPEHSVEIEYTTKCYDAELERTFAEYPSLSSSQSELLSSTLKNSSKKGSRAIIEVVTVINPVKFREASGNATSASEPLGDVTNTHIKDRYLVLHSKVLSQCTRDIVQFYPGQILSGESLVIHEPYACLLHHFPDLEHEAEKTEDSTKLQHLKVLLQFLRPMFQHYYAPAKSRLSLAQPTVRFEDIWVLLKPGSLAYTKWDDQWLGCIIAESTKLPPNDKFSQHWSVKYWILQVYWPTDELRFAKNTAFIEQYDGEQLVTSLPIYPVEIQDAQDLGERNRQLMERGQKTCKLVWGDSRYAFYEGEALSNSRNYISGHIIVHGEKSIVYDDEYHCWTFNWDTSDAIPSPDDPLSSVQRIINSKKTPTMQQCLIMSPCLSAYYLARNSSIMVHIENIKPLDIPSSIPDPILSNRKFSTINDMVKLQGYSNSQKPCLSETTGNGQVILLHGPPGSGKSHTIESISMRTRRPIMNIGGELQVTTDFDNISMYIDKWFYIAKRRNGIILIDNCDTDFSIHTWNSWTEIRLTALKRALKTFNCLLFLTTSKIGILDARISSLADLVVHIEQFDDERRSKVWDALEDEFRRKDEQIVLSKSATELLHSPKTQIDWNGHEMKRCFKTAISLATAQAHQDKNAGNDKITIDDEHFKEAMNIAHEFRQYVDSIHNFSESEMAKRLDHRNDKFDSRTVRQNVLPPPADTSDLDSDLDSPDDGDQGLAPGVAEQTQPRGTNRPGIIGMPMPHTAMGRRPQWPPPGQPRVFRPDYDPELCLPDLNCQEWDAFQEAGSNRELFRKTEFCAIDVLVGEPHIKLKHDNKNRRRRKIPPPRIADTSTAMPSGVPELIIDQDSIGPDEEPLPERIRINSPAIADAFSDITQESLAPPFLLFRPFRSLVYYEQEFRHWATQQEETLKGSAEAKATDDSMQPDAKGKRILAGLQEMHCLLSFIDTYIKKKQSYLLSDRCISVTFADLALLFNPGDLVVSIDLKQVYRVTKVTSGRHRAKTRDSDDLEYWKDETEAKFDETPLFVHHLRVEFDGTMLGPVSHISVIPRFDGKMDVTSLPIYPFRHCKDVGLRERLIERGKTFVKVAGIKHMHYTGLTLETRDEIDSQAVIDFEEALSRFPQWKSFVTHPTNEWLLRMAQDPKFKPRNNRPEDDWVSHYQNTLISKNTPCIKECCAAEMVHHDEYVEGQRMKDHIVAQMAEKTSTAPLVSINPTPLKDIKEPLTDEDYLIMSYRVYGFVLRSRKWHQLDMTYLSEVAIIGEGEGFDQLVLPPGHGDMVKSMIRQHLRDRKLASTNRDKHDVVRGKGRGLIMLLHGVPGVGKTSTAECVADSFRRPLFQITSGDLGTTAREVEEALEQNFNLASRWDCILLIDEADVFLGERSKEDFVRNSLVAVFLRMMEYYAGVLFLTTNRVGVFDEAFTSRVHISLYYPPLDRDATLQIFAKNWDRIRSRYHKNNREVEIKESEITQFALDYFENNKDGRWNGRQIRNAFQSALALAELDALGTDDLLDDTDHGRTVVLGKKNFETVAHAYRGFLDYMKQVYGADFARRARENLWRYDAFGLPKFPNALTTRLKVAEPGPPEMSQPRAPPGPQPWAAPAGPQPPQAGYGYREPQPSTSYYQPQPPPPPQQPYYPGHYDYQDQRPRHMAAQDPYVPPAPQERFASSSNPYARGGERYAAGPEHVPPTPEQSYHRGAPRESSFPGREAEDPR